MYNNITNEAAQHGLLNLPLPELIFQADKVRQDYLGSSFELCSIINAKSGSCSQDCKFCAQSVKHSADTAVYPLKSKAEIVEAARKAKGAGAGRFGIVTSGKSLSPREVNKIADAVRQINNEVGIKTCASLGTLQSQDFINLKSAGLCRYHHNIETSPGFYPRVVTTHKFQERINTIKTAKEAGLEVCSGGIIGMGESWQDRIDMACVLKELDVDSVPINILVPIKGTRFENLKPLAGIDIIRTISLFRIILKDKVIKIAAGRETVLKDFQSLGFMAGANGMLIGGYLTIAGRSIYQDKVLVNQVKKIWTE